MSDINISLNELKKATDDVDILGKLGTLFKNQMSQAAESVSRLISASSGIMFLVSKTQDAISELRQLAD